MEKLIVSVSRLDPSARLPAFAHGPQEDAGMDLISIEEVRLEPGRWGSVGTGLAIELPSGCEAQVRPRSGLARDRGVTLLNSPGTIDPGYRGEIRVLMINHGERDFTVKPGDRIAQLVVSRYVAVEWRLSDELTTSSRGAGGFGSTGEAE